MALGSFVAERGNSRKLSPGEMLFAEGDQSTAVFACTSGRINLFVTSPSGRELMLGTKTPVEGFGELSAISGSPRTATARATDSATIAIMPGDEFLHELEAEASLAIAVLRELAGQLAVSNLRLSSRSVESAEGRVAQLLVDLGSKFRRHGRGGSTELPITQDEVAAWVGSTREAAARSLASLRKAGCIKTGRGRITIVDHGALEGMACGGTFLR
jgi:CRP-like cAMP-binding protein